MKRTIPLIVAATLLTLSATRSAYAANFYVTPRPWGGTIVHIDGVINMDDDQKFAHVVSRYPMATTIVELDSPGGLVGASLIIGDMIWARGLDTMLRNGDMRFILRADLVEWTARRDSTQHFIMLPSTF